MPGKPAFLTYRLRSLSSLHAALEKDIGDEIARPLPDSARLQRMKRMRLWVKDRLAATALELRRHRSAREVFHRRTIQTA